MPSIPRIGFEWKINFGNVLSMLGVVSVAVVGWFTMDQKADKALDLSLKLPVIEQRVAALETNQALQSQAIDVSRNAQITFQAAVTETFKSIEADRREQGLVNAEISAQLAVIVSRLDEQREVLRSSEYYGPFTPGWAASRGIASVTN